MSFGEKNELRRYFSPNIHVYFGSSLVFLNPSAANLFKALHLPYWSNASFLIFDIRALWRSGALALRTERQSAGMSKTKNTCSGLDQYGAEPFKRQQFGTAGVEGVD